MKISTLNKPFTEDGFIEFLEARIASKESELLAKYRSSYSFAKGFQQPRKPLD